MRLFGLITLAFVAMALIAITPVLWQNMKEPVVAKTNDGMSEGIKVHGDWEVKVTDPETGAEELYAFRNEFAETGGNVLALALLGEADIGIFQSVGSQIYEYSPNVWQITSNLVPGEGGTLEEIGNESTEAPVCKTGFMAPVLVSIDGTVNANVGAQLMLSGLCEPDGNGSLFNVMTKYTAGSMGMVNMPFTMHYFDNPIPVQKGQVISFNVLISFE